MKTGDEEKWKIISSNKPKKKSVQSNRKKNYSKFWKAIKKPILIEEMCVSLSLHCECKKHQSGLMCEFIFHLANRFWKIINNMFAFELKRCRFIFLLLSILSFAPFRLYGSSCRAIVFIDFQLHKSIFKYLTIL